MKDNIEKYIVNSYILESLNKVNEEASISYEADVMIYEFVNHLSGVIYSLSLMGPEAKQALLQHEPFTLGWHFIPITNVKRKKPEEKNAEDYMFMKPQTEKEYVLQKLQKQDKTITKDSLLYQEILGVVLYPKFDSDMLKLKNLFAK